MAEAEISNVSNPVVMARTTPRRIYVVFHVMQKRDERRNLYFHRFKETMKGKTKLHYPKLIANSTWASKPESYHDFPNAYNENAKKARDI